MSSSRTKTTKVEEVNVVESPLTDEEKRVIEEYRAGRLRKAQEVVIDQEDLRALNLLDDQVRNILQEVGIQEERKMHLIGALDGTRKQKNSLLQEVMLRYGIPANQSFKINRETGVVSIDETLEQ